MAPAETKTSSLAISFPPRMTWRERLAWCALLGIASLAFGFGLGREPLWLDETYSYAMSQHSLAEILRLTSGDVHPPLYYLVLRVTTLIFGASPFALRLPSLFAALALIALGAGPVRQLWGPRVGWVFGILVLVSPGILGFAQEARMYTLAAFLVTSSILYGYLSLVAAEPRYLWLWGISTVAAGLTHYFALVAVGMAGILLLVAAARTRRKHLGRLSLVALLCALAYAPWLPSFWEQVNRVNSGFWIPPTSWQLVLFGLVAPFTYKFEDIPYPFEALLGLTLTVTLCAAAVVFPITVRNRRPAGVRYWGLLLLVATFLLTLGFGLGYSAFLQPIFMPRYLLGCSGLLLLATAIGLAQLPTPRQQAAATAFLLLIGSRTWWTVQTECFGGPFKLLAQEIRQLPDNMPILLHNDVQALYPSGFELREAQHILLGPAGSSLDVSQGGVYELSHLGGHDTLEPLLAHSKRIWLIDAEPAGFHVDPSFLLNHKGWSQAAPSKRLLLPWSWLKLTVTRFEKNAAP